MRRVVAVLPLVVAGLIWSAAPARAAGNCASPYGSHYFDGFTASDTSTGPPAGTIYGVVADVKYTAAPKLCKLTGNATVDQGSRISWWVMVNSPASQYRYAQVGYLRSGNGSNAAIFTEYNDGTKTDFNTVPQTSWRLDFYTPDPVDGSVHALAVGLNSGGNRLNMTFDGQVLMTTPFDPRVAWPGTWNGQVFAETHDLGDDVPGGKYTPTTFRNIRYWSTYGWGNQVAIVPRSSSADYRNAWAGIDGMDVWTERIDPGCPTCGQG